MLNILVVEDDVKLNQIICTYLNDNGYNAKGALGANEAYDLMYNVLYDLIISDIMMAGIDGFEFAETVREINKTIPILFRLPVMILRPSKEDFAWGLMIIWLSLSTWTSLFCASVRFCDGPISRLKRN